MRKYVWVFALCAGTAAALLSAGAAQADDSGGQASSHRTTTSKQATPTARSTTRTGVGQAKRPTPTTPANPPYTGRPPNHALEMGLLHLAGYLTSGIRSNGKPPAILTIGLTVTRSEYNGTPVCTLQRRGTTPQQAIVALHGGGFVNETQAFHWWSYANLARNSGAAVIVPIYPLAPTGTAAIVVPQTADIIAATIATRGADNVSLLGDSAGGGLALAAVQELVLRGAAVPRRMVLISPWLDVTISDPESEHINEPSTPKEALREYGLWWAGDLDPNDPKVSPINGSLDGLPETVIYSGSRDYLSPQTLRLREHAIAEGLGNVTFVLRNGEIHDWAMYPFLPSAVRDQAAIERYLVGN